MPTYEYECPRCSLRFELRQGFNADTFASCPQCGDEVSRVFSVVPVFYKGSGFYCTDSGRNGSNPTMRPSSGDNGNKTTAKETVSTCASKATEGADKR
ncbi:MAG: zinc ribbon domain-containing protein [Dehalococcoidia bacterium]|nr:zinc ribbon domain-containing protein [Dehalococcoidia bacterium]